MSRIQITNFDLDEVAELDLIQQRQVNGGRISSESRLNNLLDAYTSQIYNLSIETNEAGQEGLRFSPADSDYAPYGVYNFFPL
ncbi:hypothetical protein IFO70_30390 [Phormidium tenue FACHB-886]|nr:hypothetical protein [Phormidium tenue FACHB-886]